MRTKDKLMLERAVQRGVTYLDENPDKEDAFVEWYKRINVSILRMSSGLNCIIGQTKGSYSKLCEVDDFAKLTDEQLNRWAARHGFFVIDRRRRPVVNVYGRMTRDVDHQWQEDAYAYLTSLWRQEVLARQLATSLAPTGSL